MTPARGGKTGQDAPARRVLLVARASQPGLVAILAAVLGVKGATRRLRRDLGMRMTRSVGKMKRMDHGIVC